MWVFMLMGTAIGMAVAMSLIVEACRAGRCEFEIRWVLCHERILAKFLLPVYWDDAARCTGCNVAMCCTSSSSLISLVVGASSM